MARKAEGHDAHQEQVRQPARKGASYPSGSAGKKREPRGALFYGDDPTLAKRVEEELHAFGR